MQLRKLLRILSDIKKEHGDRIQVSVQTGDFQNPVYALQEINTVGVSACYYENSSTGCLYDNERFVVSLGLESPNYKEYI